MIPAPRHDPGPKPEMAWLPVASLSVDRRYQRSLETLRSRALIRRIAEHFHWSAFQAIVATPTKGGWLVIDGQHRVEGARGAGILEVPAVVIPAASMAEQARIFVQANSQRVAISPFTLYHARLAADEPSAVRTQAFCVKHGVTIPRYPIPLRALKPGQTLSVAAIERIANEGDRAGEKAVALLLRTWPDRPGTLSRLLLTAASLLIEEMPEREGEIQALLVKKPPLDWVRQYQNGGGAKTMFHDIRRLLGGRVAEVAEMPQASTAARGWRHPEDARVLPGRRAFVDADGLVRRCTKSEWQIFEALAEVGGRLASHASVYHRLYGDDPDGGPDEKIIDVMVCRLRKLCPFKIETLWGEGYLLQGYRMVRDALALPHQGADRARLMAGR